MSKVYNIQKRREYLRAGPTDLIRLAPPPGSNALFMPRNKIDALVTAITLGALVHCSGVTGSGKTALMNAFAHRPENFEHACRALGHDFLPLNVHSVHMPLFETPSEVYQRRELANGKTFDSPSTIVRALVKASEDTVERYHVIWLRELGRVHSSTVQGGLLDLLCEGAFELPNGQLVDLSRTSFVADSNYQAEGGDSVHTLVALDDAVRRRFVVNITFDYLSPDQEVSILERLVNEEKIKRCDQQLIESVVSIGESIRDYRAEGMLQSVAPPSISGYLWFLRMSARLPHFSPQEVAHNTLLGNASRDDEQHVDAVLNEVFGLKTDEGDVAVLQEGLF